MDEKPPYPTDEPAMPQAQTAIPPAYTEQAAPPPPGGYQSMPPPPGYFPQGNNTAGYPPQQSYPGYPQQPATAIIIGAGWTPQSQLATCPTCNESVMTTISYEPGGMTWLLCFIIALFCGWIFCLCLIPFCLDGTKDVVHSCPRCNRALGVHKRG